MTIAATAKDSKLTRCVSDNADVHQLSPQTPDRVDDESFSDEARVGRKRPREHSPKIPRLVSNDAQYISENDDDDVELLDTKGKGTSTSEPTNDVPAHPNPLYTSNLLFAHIKSLRLEAELFPMRVQIARLMAHPTHNRRGIFNAPVDAVALGLVDYNRIVTNPMDLGTVKAKVHALSYNSREEVADDVRLVFLNAMKYNPPNNAVHIAAKNLLLMFEEGFQVMKATSDFPVQSQVNGSYNVAAFHQSLDHGASVSASMEDVKSENMTPTASEKLSSGSENSGKVLFSTPKRASVPSDGNASTSPRHVSIVDPTSPSCTYADTKDSPTKSNLRGMSVGEPGHAKNLFAAPPQAEKALKRAMNVAAKHAKHSCRSCKGRTCDICHQGCLNHEPALLICTGSNCLGAKIRKGATYYIAKDGSRQFCQRCYTNLQAVLPHTSDQIESFGSSVRYKRDLLKRKNEEEVAEAWLTCRRCQNGVHKICVMHNEFVHAEDDYECPSCAVTSARKPKKVKDMQRGSDYYTFISGSEIPMRLEKVIDMGNILSAESLPETPISVFIQEKVRHCISETKVPNAEKTITVRVISDCSKNFKVPDVIRKHFRQPCHLVGEEGVMPPAKVNYNSKAITLFQKIDGLDVCIFCMYVQEYDCDDDYEGLNEGHQSKRVYVAYLDSVAHFRPRECRTEVFHEILVAYLATARARGYESAHIWACPPSRGNSFVFWNHPASQRTPSKERLISWYHGALSRGIESGVVTNVTSLFESAFPLSTVRSSDPNVALNPDNMAVCEEGVLDGRLTCPPLLDGDYWIEEAVRVHAANIVRHLKSKPTPVERVTGDDGCPATQVGTVIRDRVMIQKCASPFLKPVNAAALNLYDYHKVITKPMDLGTVYSRCVLGEFETLADVVKDVELVFANAMTYNPKGHVVYDMALATRELFFVELNKLTRQWNINHDEAIDVPEKSWEKFAKVSMSLDNIVDMSSDIGSSHECDQSGAPVEEGAQEMLIDTSEMTSNKLCESAHPDIHERVVCVPQSPPPVRTTSAGTRSLKSSSVCLSVNSSTKTSPGSPSNPKKCLKAVRDLVSSRLELLSGGHDAILQRMVGDDVWMMDKKSLNAPKVQSSSKKKGSGKRRKSNTETCSVAGSLEESSAKRRRQSWLGEEVGLSVRKMRTSFFTCALVPKVSMSLEEEEKERQFQTYVSSFVNPVVSGGSILPCRIADARHAFLEFSQYRNLEFDTLRRAKYSTSVLLYHLHNDNAPGLIPSCVGCGQTIQEIRWHRIRRVEERHHTGRVPPTLRAARMVTILPEVAEACHKGEELCAGCFETRTNKEEFIPLPVSLKVK